MKRLSNFFYSQSSIVYAIIATVIMVLYASLIMGGKSECFDSQLPEGMKVFGLKFGLSLDYALSLFNSLDSAGLQCYKNLILIWDNIFPLLYCSMYLFWVSLIFKNITAKNSKLKLINLFPIVPAVMDWIENILELRLVNYFIENNDLINSQVAISSFVSQLKWVFSYINYAIIVTGLVILIYKIIVKRNIN